MTDAERGEGLLRGILLHPEDDARRLVYADWLEESGELARAEFIRVQLKLHGAVQRLPVLTVAEMDPPSYESYHTTDLTDLPAPGTRRRMVPYPDLREMRGTVRGSRCEVAEVVELDLLGSRMRPFIVQRGWLVGPDLWEYDIIAAGPPELWHEDVAVKRKLIDRDEFHALQSREQELLVYWREFVGYEFLSGVIPTDALFYDHMPLTRGFVESVTCTCRAWDRHGPAVMRKHPVRKLLLTDARTEIHLPTYYENALEWAKEQAWSEVAT